MNFVGFVGSPLEDFPITQVPEATEEAVRPPQAPAFLAGEVLLAPRYDGGGEPLAAIPECWCCRNPYRLERLQEWHGKTYAFLQPGCGCLDAWGCYACFACREHCRCSGSRDSL